ncbi:uncharacterized protein si:dkey-20d21.12 isoform X1 [Electrophorus electricus]|uniref:uncharacterized protein si:dkey-20d21.12 isoform X1 n=1 Tax=Electrophorus electricus TaxID=8005 RepID=UPI0015CFC8A0|nr:uncharacterized protein si:dkey-20d21.12 isoform X1 [Electrophorus electricus]XP_035377837.1 uncharacterized protein si:dkey-20d21.12 isoform X1 [Electrophorus electricus]
MQSQGVPPAPSTPLGFVQISDKDLTEIELHSVDSISDLHRAHPEQHGKGCRPARPKPPSINGKLQSLDKPAICQSGHQMRRSHLKQLSSMCIPCMWRYSLACVALTLILLTLILIFSFLVQQSRALHTLSEMVSQRQETTEEISILIQELQALRRNLTALGDRH